MRTQLTCLFGMGFLITGLCAVTSGQDMPESVLEKVKNAAAQVAIGEKEDQKDEIKIQGFGSGWFINDSGLLFTNNHVAMPGHFSDDPMKHFRDRSQFSVLQYPVTLHGGTEDEVTYSGQLLYQSETADLAILQVKDKEGEFLYTPDYLTLKPSEEVEKGDRIWVFGYPGGTRFAVSSDKSAPVQVTNGNVTQIERHPSGRIGKINTDAQGAQGNSGGPVVDEDGRLVGVLVEGRANVDVSTGVAVGLIPANVVMDMMRAALGLNKITTELRPFLDLLYDKNGRVFLPGEKRDPVNDFLTFSDGGKQEGKILNEDIPITSPLGTINVPRDFAGYLHNEAGRMTLLMDGGNRLTGDSKACKLRFSTSRNRGALKEMPVNVADIQGILFSRPSEAIDPPDIPSLQLRGDGNVLTISDIKGDIVFESEGGETKNVKLSDLRRIEFASYKTTLHKLNGAKIRGSFKPHTIKAIMTWTGTPIEFSLENVKNVQVRESNPAHRWGGSIDLASLAGITDRDLKPIASTIDRGDLKKAGGLLDELRDEETFRRFPKPVRYQINVLYAEYLLRSGQYDEAREEYRGVKNALFPTNWYGLSRSYVLEKYENGKYFGEPLSDPAVFSRAGKAICAELVDEARGLMIAHRRTQPEKFSTWQGLDRKLSRQEEPLLIAEFLNPGNAEMDLFRLWRSRTRLMFEALQKLQERSTDLQREIQIREADNKSIQSQQRKLDKIQAEMGKISTAYGALRAVMNPIGDDTKGYRVDDPDAMEILN